VIDQNGVMQYADSPLLANLPHRDPALSVALNLAVQPLKIYRKSQMSPT